MHFHRKRAKDRFMEAGLEEPSEVQESQEMPEQSTQEELGLQQPGPETEGEDQKYDTKHGDGGKAGDAVGKGSFVHGLSVGLGIGSIATFVIMWVTLYFTPQLPSTITYENLLAVFIYPLIYLLAVGLVALTAGIVKEYYARR